MAAGLAGVIHDCQDTNSHKHNRSERNSKGVFIVTSLTRVYHQL
jgi:hypothetical protein